MSDDTCGQGNTSQDEKKQDSSSQSPGPELGLVSLARQDSAASAAKDLVKQITEDAAPVVETGGELAEKGLLETYLGIFISLVGLSSDTPCGQDGQLWFNAINPTTGKKYESNDECVEVHARQGIAEYQRYQLQLAAEASGNFSDGSVNSCTQTCEASAATPAPETSTPVPKPRRNPNQTCDDEVLDRLEAEKDALAKAIPPLDPKSPHSRNPKKMEKVPCSRIKARLSALESFLAKRWQIENECYGGKPDDDHQREISNIEKAIKSTKALEAVNCAPGHPMSTK